MANVPTIPHLKRLFIQLLMVIIKSFVILGRGLVFVLKMIALPFRFLVSFLFSAVAVNLYKRYLPIKMRLAVLWRPAKHSIFYPFSTKYFLHGVMVIAVLFVTAANVRARETKTIASDRQTILSSLLQGNDNDQIIEYATTSKEVRSQNEGIGGLSPADISVALAEETVVTNQDNSILQKPSLTTTEVGSRPRTGVAYHTVEGGETISQIAEHYNISINTILWENNLSATSLIKPGLKLTILPMTGISHQVQSGETLATIVKKYGGDVQEILDQNHLPSADVIAKGDILLLPNGKPPTPAPVVRLASASSGSGFFGTPPPNSSSVPSSGKLLWPGDSNRINQYYSLRHRGIDIHGTYSSPIYAAADGVVTTAGWGSGYGLHVVLNNGGGMVTLYGHASKLFVKVGDRVSRGQTMGIVGCTGWCTGPHIHFEVRINGAFMNPLSYL